MTESEKVLKFIESQISNGLTVYITNQLKSTCISPKTYAAWNKTETKILKIDSEGNLRLVSGKKYNIICTKTICMAKISAH